MSTRTARLVGLCGFLMAIAAMGRVALQATMPWQAYTT